MLVSDKLVLDLLSPKLRLHPKLLTCTQAALALAGVIKTPTLSEEEAGKVVTTWISVIVDRFYSPFNVLGYLLLINGVIFLLSFHYSVTRKVQG